jgi:hypothetical protein
MANRIDRRLDGEGNMSIRRLATALLTTAILLTAASPLQAIGPTVMMFYGGTLPKPVFVTGADTAAFGDLLRPATMSANDLGNRPYVSVALFWGPANDPALNGRPVAELTPEMAWQHGRLYFATTSQPAVLLVTQLTKSTQAIPAPTAGATFSRGGPIPDTALVVLKRLGITAASDRK